MRLDFEIGGNAGRLTGINRLEIDGKLYEAPDAPPTPLPAPPPSAAKTLSPLYFDGDSLGADVKAIKPGYQVIADGNRLDGSGGASPAIVYHTQTPEENVLRYVVLDNPEHPYFNGPAAPALPGLTKEHVKQLAQAAPLVQETHAVLAAGGNPVDAWKLSFEPGGRVQSPGEISLLLMYTGGGAKNLLRAKAYRILYYQQPWGRQAPGDIRNQEASLITDEQLAAFRAFPASALAAMAAGNDPGIPIPN